MIRTAALAALVALCLPACGPPSPGGLAHAAGDGAGGDHGSHVPCATRTEDACAADGACVYLAPGCGEPTLPAAGCFPADADCRKAGCEAPFACRGVYFNPCGDHLCAVDCADQVYLCLR